MKEWRDKVRRKKKSWIKCDVMRVDLNGARWVSSSLDHEVGNQSQWQGRGPKVNQQTDSLLALRYVNETKITNTCI